MAEEKTEKKKTGIVKRIFKWLGLGLLSILLIAAVIFQAPWKVITLLAVLLCACALLAKPVRKWFWLSVAAVVVILIIWVFLPDERPGWQAYTFDEELATLEAKYAVADEENAATIYDELLENYDANDFEPNLPDPNAYYLTRSEPWSSQDYPELAEWLKGHQGTIAKLTEASEIKQCRFPINASILILDQQMDRVGAMKSWASLLIRAANNDLGEGRDAEALGKYIATLGMGEHSCQQSAMIDMLVGMAIEALAVRELNSFIITSNATEEYLNVIEKALRDTEHDWNSDGPRVLEGEKLLAKNFWGMFYEVNSKGKIRFIRNPFESFLAKFEQMEIKKSNLYWQRKLCKAYTIWMWFYMPSTPQKAGEAVDEAYQKYFAMAEPGFDWSEEPKELSINPAKLKLNYSYLVKCTTDILEGAYYRFHDYYLQVGSDKRGSQLIIALRRYRNKTGHWPESLEEVKPIAPAEIFVDPFNNDSFIYKLTDDGFTLYSKGKNNIDEDGKRDRWDEEKTGADDWLIWPQKGLNAKEVKTDAH